PLALNLFCEVSKTRPLCPDAFTGRVAERDRGVPCNPDQSISRNFSAPSASLRLVLLWSWSLPCVQSTGAQRRIRSTVSTIPDTYSAKGAQPPGSGPIGSTGGTCPERLS